MRKRRAAYREQRGASTLRGVKAKRARPMTVWTFPARTRRLGRSLQGSESQGLALGRRAAETGTSLAVVPNRPMRSGLGAIVLALAISGCSPALFSGRDVRIEASGETLYIFARSDWVSRNFCSTLSSYAPVVEARWAPIEGRLLRLRQVQGCYMVRQIIVCEEGNDACLQHLARRPGPAAHSGSLQTRPPR